LASPLQSRKLYKKLVLYLLVFLLFYLSTLFSTIYNFYNFNYAKGGIFFFRIPLFAISIWFILERYEFFNKKMVAFLLLLFLLIIFDSLLQYYSGKNLLGYEIIKGRLSSFFGDELILGSFIIRLIPIFMIYLVMNDLIGDKKINFIYLLIISFACLVVYLSGERTSFGLLILFFFILFFMVKILRKFVILTFLAFLSLAFIASNLKTSSEIDPAKRMFNKSYSQIIGKGEERYEKHKKKLFNKFYIFSHDHHGHYVLSYRSFKDHILFGTGVKGFRYLCRNKIYILENNDGCSTHPHNTYLQLLTEIGLVGFLFVIIILLYTIKYLFKHLSLKFKKKYFFNDFEICILSGIIIYLWPIVPTGNIFNNWLSIMLILNIPFLIWSRKTEKDLN